MRSYRACGRRYLNAFGYRWQNAAGHQKIGEQRLGWSVACKKTSNIWKSLREPVSHAADSIEATSLSSLLGPSRNAPCSSSLTLNGVVRPRRFVSFHPCPQVIWSGGAPLTHSRNPSAAQDEPAPSTAAPSRPSSTSGRWLGLARAVSVLCATCTAQKEYRRAKCPSVAGRPMA